MCVFKKEIKDPSWKNITLKKKHFEICVTICPKYAGTFLEWT